MEQITTKPLWLIYLLVAKIEKKAACTVYSEDFSTLLYNDVIIMILFII